jgi:hypothetical protein
MISDKQLEANRRNALRSTGPRTTEGKAQSRRNNLRHGLTGQINILPTEDREAHDAFCNELSDSLKPETPMEHQLAHSVAEDSWRLNRARAIENNMFALGHTNERHEGEHREVHIALADARTFQSQANQFQLLTIYEQRINRNLQRNLKQLHELQAERKTQREQALEEAQLLAQLNLINGIPNDPAADLKQNGFVFSNAEIKRAIDRNNRLREARKLASEAVPAPRRPSVMAA